MELNETQRLAVEQEGNTIVIAGPGTGKTLTLVARAVYWLHHGLLPSEMLLLTFSRKAAEEIGERVMRELEIKVGDKANDGQLGHEINMPYTGTIHSWCYSWLNRELGDLPQLIDENQQIEIVKDLAKVNNLEGNTKDWILALSIYRTGGQFYESTVLERKIGKKMFGYLSDLSINYEQALRERGVMDFDDILLRTYKLLDSEKYTYKPIYKQILVDEFQDLNLLQLNVVRHLQRKNNRSNLFVVGDPWQGIYGFRGAEVEIFDRLKTQLSTYTEFTLDINYRSSQGILDLSGKLFSTKRKLQTYARKPMQAIWLQSPNDKTEAYWVLNQLKQMISDENLLTISKPIISSPIGLSDIAICYRSYNSVRTLVKSLDSSALPYQVIGEKKLIDYQDVQTVISFLEKFQHNSVNFEKKELNLLKVLHARSEISMELALELVCKKLVSKSDFPHNWRMEKLRQIAWTMSGVSWMTALPFFFLELKQLSEIDSFEINADKLSVISLHAAKGLEFEAVFIVGVEEGLLPHSKSIESGLVDEIEEERRLLYVGMTRAKRLLYLTTVNQRYIYGEVLEQKPSRFMRNFESSTLLTTERDKLAKRWEKQLQKKRKKERQGRLF